MTMMRTLSLAWRFSLREMRGGLSGFQTPLRMDSTSPTREEGFLSAVDVFPNPVEGWLSIQVEADGPKQLRLFNAAGQEVAQQEWTAPNTVLDTRTLPAGLYILSITAEGQTIGKKVIVR